jgi:cell pole-organizing protein PopZ
MTQTAKAQEPSMEEILASIRRIIADDDASKPAKAPETAAPPKPPAAAAPSRPMPPATPAKSATSPPPTARPAAPVVANSQDAIDAMLAELDGPPNAAPRPAATQPDAPAADVLDLTEAMAEQTPSPGPAPTFRTIDGTSDVGFSTKPEPPPDRALISNETIAAVDSAFNTLAHTVIGQNARTLEDLVREMLRPMLKSWLDDNLPSMVERIVRAEIERVSRGRP